jgi:membrane protease YdiL (CAAX protease family)
MTAHRTGSPGPGAAPPAATPQHSLGQSVALHLLPGAAMTVFILLAAPVVRGWGFPTVFALFLGIPLVIVPLELGYLLYQAKRRTGTWSLAAVVDYREPLPVRKYALWGGGLATWWIVVLLVSVSVVDARIADGLFSWMPASILEFSTFEDGQPVAWALAVTLVVAFVFNGLVGPVVEELYFRGHLLPAIDRLGGWAPVLNAVLFSVYHFWTPWANPGRIVAMLPWVYVVWRSRSLHLSIVVHVAVNLTFLLLILAVFL